jgi:hypothetical protein
MRRFRPLLKIYGGIRIMRVCRNWPQRYQEYVVAKARAIGADRIMALPVDGPRNGPAKAFFAAKYSTSDAAAIDPARVRIPPQIGLREEVLDSNSEL